MVLNSFVGSVVAERMFLELISKLFLRAPEVVMFYWGEGVNMREKISWFCGLLQKLRSAPGVCLPLWRRCSFRSKSIESTMVFLPRRINCPPMGWYRMKKGRTMGCNEWSRRCSPWQFQAVDVNAFPSSNLPDCLLNCLLTTTLIFALQGLEMIL